jgi:hypothetical protein
VRYLVFAVLALAFACSRPKPPTIVPERAVVTAVGPAGVEMSVELGVDNPNGVDLSARAVTANVVLDGRHRLRPVTVPNEFRLVARSRTRLVVPMSIPWEDVSTLIALATANRSIPYDLDGTVNLGGDLLHIDVPFHLTGVVTQEQLLQATLNSLPRLAP